jgi:hypothetical protein
MREFMFMGVGHYSPLWEEEEVALGGGVSWALHEVRVSSLGEEEKIHGVWSP